MKCHYEILGIPQSAAVEDIKKSYRKLALEWHPDKNLHRTEEATETFQLIQQAYEILIDPQERAWYDRNREKIIRGDEEYVDNHLDVYQYFNTSRFKGYDDGEKSFYTVYREVFEKIAEEDKPFMDGEDVAFPSFGYSYSPYKEVVYVFYAYWQSYCTSKSYSWEDKFDIVEGRKCGVGRQVIRCMERDNKKSREQHRKVRNEEVRELVAFVKKRDKRITEYKKQLEVENAEKAKKAQEHRRKQLEERKKHLANYKETEWASMSALEHHLNEIEANLDNEFGAGSSSDKGEEDSFSDAEEISDLYCIACDKAFRSAKAMTNHQNSKKHKENVASLKELMDDEDLGNLDECLEDFLKTADEDLLKTAAEDLLKTGEQDTGDSKQSTSKGKKKKKKKPKEQLTDEKDFHLDSIVKDVADVQEDVAEVQVDDVAESKESNSVQVDNCAASNSETTEKETYREDSVLDPPQDKKNPKSVKKKLNTTATVKDDLLEQDREQDRCKMEANLDISTLECESVPKNFKAPLLTAQGSKGKTVIEEETAKKSRNAQRKAKKKAAMDGDSQTEEATTTCVKCGKCFGSRNKLFDHLKETGHSMFLSDKDRVTLKKKRDKFNIN